MDYYILTIAFYLSVLTYYIGVLILALPIPWYGIKKWGPILIVDGIKSAILVFSFNIIILSVAYISEVIGINWYNFNAWIVGKISELVLLYTFLFSLQTVASKVISGITGIFTSPLLSLITYSIILLETFLIVGAVVYSYCSKFIAIGILLHNIPFRISRAAGSTLIAFAIIYFIGLPLLPTFIETITTPTITPKIDLNTLKTGVAYGTIYLKDIIGKPIPYAILKITMPNDKSKILALYISNSEGIINALSLERGLPADEEYLVEVEYLGRIIPVTPNPINPKQHYKHQNETPYIKLVLKAIDTIVYRYISFSFEEGTIINYIKTNATLMKLIIKCNNKKYIELRIPDEIELVKIYDNNTEIVPIRKEILEWYGVTYTYYKVEVEEGVHNLEFHFNFNNFTPDKVKPNASEVPYLSNIIGEDNIIEAIHRLIALFFFTYFIAPLSYFFILISVTYGLASFIGGRRAMRIPVRVI